MIILGVVDFDNQLVFRYILPERFMVNKFDLTFRTDKMTSFFEKVHREIPFFKATGFFVSIAYRA